MINHTLASGYNKGFRDGYEKGKANGKREILSKARCEDANCFECAFGSAEGCLLKGENK